jgi:hypothetical protein
MQDSIRPTMPTSMILRRSEILAQIAAAMSNKWSARNSGHRQHLIRDVRTALVADPSQISVLHHILVTEKGGKQISY